MKIDFRYNKFGNFFFFVSNLSEWSFHCRKKYNEEWLRSSHLSKKEKNDLDKIANFLKRNEGDNIINIFLLAKSKRAAFHDVSLLIDKKDLRIIKDSFDIFKNRFDKIWKIEKNIFKKAYSEINNKKRSIKLSLDSISKIYNVKNSPIKITVVLLLNPLKNRLIGGGSSIGKNAVAIEYSGSNLNKDKDMFQRVLVHEITHSSFEENTKEEIQKYIKSDKFKNEHGSFLEKSLIYKQVPSLLTILKEMILVSFVPDGYLAEKFFGKNIIKMLRQRKCIRDSGLQKNYHDLMLYDVFKLYPMAKKYLDRAKCIDFDYIDLAMNCWVEFETMNTDKWYI